jgi:hypothetical protein
MSVACKSLCPSSGTVDLDTRLVCVGRRAHIVYVLKFYILVSPSQAVEGEAFRLGFARRASICITFQSCMQLVALLVRLIPRPGCKSAPGVAAAQVSFLNGCHGRVV